MELASIVTHTLVSKYSNNLYSDLLHHVVLSGAVTHNFLTRKTKDWYSEEMIVEDDEHRKSSIAADWTYGWAIVSTLEMIFTNKVEKQFLLHHVLVIVLNRLGYYAPKKFHFHVANIGLLEWTSIILAYASTKYGGIKGAPQWYKAFFAIVFLGLRFGGYYSQIFPKTMYHIYKSEEPAHFKWPIIGFSGVLFALNLHWGKLIAKSMIKR